MFSVKKNCKGFWIQSNFLRKRKEGYRSTGVCSIKPITGETHQREAGRGQDVSVYRAGACSFFGLLMTRARFYWNKVAMKILLRCHSLLFFPLHSLLWIRKTSHWLLHLERLSSSRFLGCSCKQRIAVKAPLTVSHQFLWKRYLLKFYGQCNSCLAQCLFNQNSNNAKVCRCKGSLSSCFP